MTFREIEMMDVPDVAANVDEILDRHPAVGLAVGVVRSGHKASIECRGVADLATGTPVTEDTVFRIASITKTFTAIAVLQLWERGRVDLDAPANTYLRAYRLIPADGAHSPVTLRHLLTHTAGLPEVVPPLGAFMPDFGESVKDGRRLPSLAEFYGEGLRGYAEPGTRFVYNNHGPATLGQIVEDVSGLPLGRYFRQHIFEPLAMADSDLLRSDLVRSKLASGYEIGRRGARRVAERDMVTAGAASIYSTPRDMARYLVALLGEGSNEHGSILEPPTLAVMFEPHYQPDPRLPGMGLGFFRGDIGGTWTVGHQGSHPGFHSQITLAPDAGVGVMAFTNGGRQPDFWLPAEASRVLRLELESPRETAIVESPQGSASWSEVCGWYRLDARFNDVRLRGMLGFGAEVFVRCGRLMLRFLTPIPELARGFVLESDDAVDVDVFRIDLSDSGVDETMRVAVGRNATGTPDRLVLDVMPLVLGKQPAWSNPRRWAVAAAAATLTGVVVAAVVHRRS